MNLAGLMGYVYWVYGLMDGWCGLGLGLNALGCLVGRNCCSAGDVAAAARNVPKYMLSPSRHKMASDGDISPYVLSHGGPAALAMPKPHAIPSP